MSTTPRITFGTKLGVIAATVGSAVGLGNIWRFPYEAAYDVQHEAGSSTSGVFLIIYLLCIVGLALPVMLGEFVIGRGGRSNVSGAYRSLKPRSYWHFFGSLGIVAAVLIMGFYSVVAGWTLDYVYQAATGALTGKTALQYDQAFTAFKESWQPLGWTVLVLLINYVIISRGVKKGIEQASNILTPLLFVILVIFCIRAFFLPEAATGLRALFYPDFSKVNANVFLRALGQAFFSLSLGMGTMTTYASYFSEKTSLPKTAITVCLLDTLVAIMAGIIVFTAVSSFNDTPIQGPTLVFVTLPNVFQGIPGAYIWSTLFFLLLSVAAVTSTISLCEVVVAYLHEEFNLKRKRATQILMGIVLLLSIPCALSSGLLSEFRIFGMTVFDFCDFTASNILLPLGGIFIAVFVGWILKRQRVYAELSNHGALPVRLFPVLIFLLRYVAPIAILLIFLSSIHLF